MTAAPETSAEGAAASPRPPLVYLGLRRGWWVVVSFLLLCGVDALPLVGPYLALAVLMWMVIGLARARPGTPRPARAPRAARVVRITRVPRRTGDHRRSGERPLPSS